MTHDIDLPVTMTRNSDLRVGGPNLPLAGPPGPPPPPIAPNLLPVDRGYSTRSLVSPYPYPFLPYTASSASLRGESTELLTKERVFHEGDLHSIHSPLSVSGDGIPEWGEK